MKYGLSLPNLGELADPLVIADLAVEAESEGWDGVFVWDHVYYREPVRAAADPWTAMTLIAVRTAVIELGPLVVPLARRRPQVVARQVAALDRLSGGRFILGTGLGLDRSGGEFERFGEPDVRHRADRYDEGLTLTKALLSGDQVYHEGRYYSARGVRFLPAPTRRVPVWTAMTRWPARRPLSRAAAHDGAAIINFSPAQTEELCHELREGGADLSTFDVAVQSASWADPSEWRAAGATWLIAAFDPFTVTPDVVRTSIQTLPHHDSTARS